MHLVFVSQAAETPSLDVEAAFAGELRNPVEPCCDAHGLPVADRMLHLDTGAGVGLAPLRMTWRSWFLDHTRLGRLVWLHQRDR